VFGGSFWGVKVWVGVQSYHHFCSSWEVVLWDPLPKGRWWSQLCPRGPDPLGGGSTLSLGGEREISLDEDDIKRQRPRLVS